MTKVHEACKTISLTYMCKEVDYSCALKLDGVILPMLPNLLSNPMISFCAALELQVFEPASQVH